MALFRAAEWAGCFGEGAAQAAALASEEGETAVAAPASLPIGIEGRQARIIVDVGARATRVLAVIEDRLVDLRSLRLGVDAIAQQIASRFGLGLDEARDVVRVGLETGRDVSVAAGPVAQLPEVAPADLEPDVAVEELPPETKVIGHEDILAAREAFFDRLQRELWRFLAGLPRVSGVERLFVTGGGSTVPGVTERLGQLFDCSPQPLDVLSRLGHGLDEQEAAEIGPRIVTAVGLALAMLGGRGGFDFRQEEFAYRRHFDRVKFPLAIACMLAVFLPFIYGIRQKNQLDQLAQRYGELYEAADGGGAQGRRGASGVRATYWGYVGMLMNEGEPQNVIRPLGSEKFAELNRGLVEQETFQRLPTIRTALEKELQHQQESTGVFEDLQLPSGVYVISYFADVIQRIEGQLGSFLVAEFDLNMQPRQPSLTVKLAMRGADFRERVALLQDSLRATFGEVTSPFREFGLAGSEDVFREGDGAYVTMKIELKEEFEPRVER
jgi:hypothetical protein